MSRCRHHFWCNCSSYHTPWLSGTLEIFHRSKRRWPSPEKWSCHRKHLQPPGSGTVQLWKTPSRRPPMWSVSGEPQKTLSICSTCISRCWWCDCCFLKGVTVRVRFGFIQHRQKAARHWNTVQSYGVHLLTEIFVFLHTYMLQIINQINITQVFTKVVFKC